MTKTCPRCKESKPLAAYWQRADGRPASRCKTCSTAVNREWRASHPDYERARYQSAKTETRERHLIRKYGVSLSDYDRMLASQDGKCAICRCDEASQHNGVFHVDHCHATGAVRGLLCRGCNHVLGHVKDDPETLRRAISYLTPELIGRAILEARAAA